ncbi:unnamed protein product [Miscanthus lutarioriparius]|uniref:J domain-containing protein n=1 Tax=Miscanthus lutarioriparius TaxID=422564 RepID=A0A811PBY6_9POAL|nr:unnamed protein product [Miscanthus lutarioriparius]
MAQEQAQNKEHPAVPLHCCSSSPPQMPDATPKQIKKAYYNCMKSCHPDLSGNDPDMTNFCMFINEVYTVGLMLAGMGGSVDVFRMASSRWEKRQAKVLEKVRRRMSQDDSSTGGSWSDIWGAPTRYEKNEEEAKERAKRAAAAARRWREYSRKGADKPPTFKLPEAVPNKE